VVAGTGLGGGTHGRAPCHARSCVPVAAAAVDFLCMVVRLLPVFSAVLLYNADVPRPIE